MNFQPQPYPLFAVRIFDRVIETARIIGWSVPDHDNQHTLYPVALFDEDDRTVTDARLLDLEQSRFWVSADLEWAMDQARDALAYPEVNR